MKPNLLRQLLREGKPTLGTHVLSPWPATVEVIGLTEAFDYIEFVGEYAPFSLEQLDNFGRTIELFPKMSSMMKVEEQARGFIATRALDSGIQNVLFTDVRSAADVRECIQQVRAEAPEAGGLHGVSMRRTSGYGYGNHRDWVEAMNEVVVAVMIEKKGAMEHIEEILSVDGLDMVQFGPSDYSISIGLAGQSSHPSVQEAHHRMIKLALEAGKHPRVEIGSFEQAKPYVDMGVRHFCIGWDVRILREWCLRQGAAMRELLGAS